MRHVTLSNNTPIVFPALLLVTDLVGHMYYFSLLLEIYLGICSIAHDCTSIDKERVVFQHDFVGKNIIDLNNIYIDEIDRSLLTTELSFIGYKGFGNFLRIFQILIFFHFLSKK